MRRIITKLSVSAEMTSSPRRIKSKGQSYLGGGLRITEIQQSKNKKTRSHRQKVWYVQLKNYLHCSSSVSRETASSTAFVSLYRRVENEITTTSRSTVLFGYWNECSRTRLKHDLQFYTLQRGYSHIANALNVCNLTDTVGNCETDCASALQSIRTNFGCCFNAYYNSTGILSTCASSLAAYELWASVPNVYSNPFPVDPGDGAFVRGNAQLLL